MRLGRWRGEARLLLRVSVWPAAATVRSQSWKTKSTEFHSEVQEIQH
jgi:hypothetical protein